MRVCVRAFVLPPLRRLQFCYVYVRAKAHEVLRSYLGHAWAAMPDLPFYMGDTSDAPGVCVCACSRVCLRACLLVVVSALVWLESCACVPTPEWLRGKALTNGSHADNVVVMRCAVCTVAPVLSEEVDAVLEAVTTDAEVRASLRHVAGCVRSRRRHRLTGWRLQHN